MTTSKKPVVGGVHLRTPLLLLLVVLVVTCFARARPTEVKASRVHYNSANFNAYCWDTIDDFKKLIEDKRDTNGIAYKSYNPKFHYKNHTMKTSGGTIDLHERCGEDGKEDTPYRYWFWIKGNKLRVSGDHWSTDFFMATTKPLTPKHNTDGYGPAYDSCQYKNDHVKTERLSVKSGGFVGSLGGTVSGHGLDIYVIDLKPWFDHNYKDLVNGFHGYVYMQTVASIYSAGGHRYSGPHYTMQSWLDGASARSFGSEGKHEYKDHYNQRIPVNKSIRHYLTLYRMHPSKGHGVSGDIDPKSGRPLKECQFNRYTRIAKEKVDAGSTFGFDSSILTYEEDGKKYYLKGIRRRYQTLDGKWRSGGKFFILTNYNEGSIVGTNRTTTEYSRVNSSVQSESQKDSVSAQEYASKDYYKFSVDKHSFDLVESVGTDKNEIMMSMGGDKDGLKGEKTWKELANYMKKLTWKNGIVDDIVYLTYEEIPKGKVQVYNKVYEYDDELGNHKCVSGESTPVYSREMDGGSKAVSVKLETENQKSKSVKSLSKTGCAPVSVLRRSVNYYPKWIHASYYDMDNKKHTVEYNISDYVYNSSKKSVRKKPSGFKDTANEKCYAGVSSGHAKAEEAFTAITKYVISHANLTGVNPSGDVMFSISYYQPKVPNVLLKYYRYYNEKGKPVDTLISKETLDNTCINSTSKKDNYLGFAYYYTDIGIGKDSKGKWTVITDSNRDKLTDLKWNTPLVSEAAYNSNVKDYHGATTNSWESKSGLTTKRDSKVDKKYSSGMHSIWYQTGVKGNAVKLIYGEKKASYTINIYRGESNSEVKSVDQIDWTLGNTITQSVNTTDKRESIRTVFVKIMDTLEGTGVTAVNLSSYKLQRQLTWAENEELITAGPPKERDGSQTTIVWPKDSTESVVLNLYYVSKVGGPDDPPDNPGDPPKDPPGTSKTTTTLEWDDLKNPMGTEHEPSEDSSHDNCSISGVVQKDNVSTVSAIDDSANAEVGEDIILPNGKMDWSTGKYVPNTLKTGSKTTAYLSKGVIKKHNVTTQFLHSHSLVTQLWIMVMLCLEKQERQKPE